MRSRQYFTRSCFFLKEKILVKLSRLGSLMRKTIPERIVCNSNGGAPAIAPEDRLEARQETPPIVGSRRDGLTRTGQYVAARLVRLRGVQV